MATITKRPPQTPGGKERWVAWYTDQNGKRRNKTFAKQKEAKAWLDRTVIEVADGVHTPASDSITIAEAGELWIAQGRTDGLEASTLMQYRQHLDLHITPFIGRIKLAELKPAHLQRLRDQLIANGRSRDMVKRVVVSLGAILAAAISYGKLARNIVRDQARNRGTRERRVAERQKKRPEVGVDVPSKDELRAVLGVANGRTRALLAISIFTGLRASEVRGLRWQDVQLDVGVLTVRQRADRFNTIGAPKSEAGKRTVPLASIVINALREWKLSCPRGAADLVFPTGSGQVMNGANLNRDIWGPLQFAAGITNAAAIRAQRPELSERAAAYIARRKPKYGFRAFRHAAVALLIEEGWSPKKVQETIGHASVQTTFDVYGYLFKDAEEDRAAIQRVQARLLG